LVSSPRHVPLALTPVHGRFAGILQSRCGKAFIPTLADFFFLALILWLFVAGPSGWKALFMDGDTGWHIRLGQSILEQKAVPTHDLFSFSKAGAPWFAWEWLSDVLYGILFRAAGLKAIALWSAGLIAAYGTLLISYAIWKGANPLVAAAAALLAIGASSVHFLARPHLATVVLLPLSIWLIEADRRRNTKLVWLLIPLTAVWVNLHGGFVMLLVCLILLTLGTGIEALLKHGSLRSCLRPALLLLGCSAASLANPYGFALHVHILDYLRSDWIRNAVQEFQAPTFRGEGQFQLEILLVVGLITAGFLIKK